MTPNGALKCHFTTAYIETRLFLALYFEAIYVTIYTQQREVRRVKSPTFFVKIGRFLMNCRNCGSPVSEQASFCPQCGAQLSAETVQQGAPVNAANPFAPENGQQTSPISYETLRETPPAPQTPYQQQPVQRVSGPAAEQPSYIQPPMEGSQLYQDAMAAQSVSAYGREAASKRKMPKFFVPAMVAGIVLVIGLVAIFAYPFLLKTFSPNTYVKSAMATTVVGSVSKEFKEIGDFFAIEGLDAEKDPTKGGFTVKDLRMTGGTSDVDMTGLSVNMNIVADPANKQMGGRLGMVSGGKTLNLDVLLGEKESFLALASMDGQRWKFDNDSFGSQWNNSWLYNIYSDFEDDMKIDISGLFNMDNSRAQANGAGDKMVRQLSDATEAFLDSCSFKEDKAAALPGQLTGSYTIMSSSVDKKALETYALALIDIYLEQLEDPNGPIGQLKGFMGSAYEDMAYQLRESKESLSFDDMAETDLLVFIDGANRARAIRIFVDNGSYRDSVTIGLAGKKHIIDHIFINTETDGDVSYRSSVDMVGQHVPVDGVITDTLTVETYNYMNEKITVEVQTKIGAEECSVIVESKSDDGYSNGSFEMKGSYVREKDEHTLAINSINFSDGSGELFSMTGDISLYWGKASADSLLAISENAMPISDMTEEDFNEIGMHVQDVFADLIGTSETTVVPTGSFDGLDSDMVDRDDLLDDGFTLVE